MFKTVLLLGLASFFLYSLISSHSIAQTPVAKYGFNGSERPVIVELYTSQGCSSCPPADEFLSRLSMQNNVIALSFHVDYWNYIGWKDPYSDAQYTYRQRQYNNTMKRRNVYTPQMIVDGYLQASGNQRPRVMNFIRQALEQQESIDIGINQITTADFDINISSNTQTSAIFDIWLISYDNTATTKVARGENRGRTLTNANIVRSLDHVGQWSQNGFSNFRFQANWEHIPDTIVVLVQEPRNGRIIGAKQIIYKR